MAAMPEVAAMPGVEEVAGVREVAEAAEEVAEAGVAGAVEEEVAGAARPSRPFVALRVGRSRCYSSLPRP
jgi:hypothetical protein